MKKKNIRFERADQRKFFTTLNKRVNDYFRQKSLKKTGNFKLYFKTLIMFILLVTPYFLITIFNFHFALDFALCIIMGIGVAGVGMNVMHDANHGSFSSKKWVNKIMGSSIYLLAGNVYNWKVQHNLLHHTFTNIHEHDEDLEAGRILRFSKHTPWKKHHRYQHLYSILLYGLLTINWSLTSDITQMIRYRKQKLSVGTEKSDTYMWSILILTKILYFIIWIVLPIFVFDIAWYQVVIGFFVMHYIAGLILSMIFQLAHIVEKAETPTPNESGFMKNTWAIHQLFTTANFGTRSKFLNWFSGGLNHQIEHHIFPNISHVHYSKIAEIVKSTAKEFNLPYHEYSSIWIAIESHFNHLKHLGNKPAVAV